MSYIIKKNEPLVNLKLTDNGRRNLANGALNFSKFGLGDSEVDYLTHDSSITSILRPVDNNSDIMYPVAHEANNYFVSITNINAIPKDISQEAKERGIFNLHTESKRQINNDLISAVGIIDNVSGNELEFTNTLNGYVVKEGDYLIIKVPYINTNSVAVSGYTFDDDLYDFDTVDSLIVFQVIATGTTLTVDRDLPNFPHFQKASCTVISGPDWIENVLDQPNPVSYWNDSVLNFDLNGSTTADDVPVWNFNVVLIEDMIGVDPTVDKNKTQTKGKKLLGTSVLFKQYEGSQLDKIGVIHYTNNTISNWYGEGFYKNTFQLDLPQIMWHKKQTNTDIIGYTFICDTTQKVLDNKVRYYDLIDQEKIPTVVGKVFIDYKICVIEDAELIMAMSYKSNRNWTLPKPKLSTTEPGTCLGSSVSGSVKPGESLHVSYIMYDTNGITPVHCNNFSTVTIKEGPEAKVKDVIFEFPKDTSNPLYNEFNFLKNYDDTTDSGFKSNRIGLIWQKTDAGRRPNPHLWKIKDITNYLATTGCINQNPEIVNDFKLATETVLLPNFSGTDPIDPVELQQPAIGSIILGVNGVLKLEANSIDDITTTNPFYFDKETNSVYFDITLAGALIQIYYLTGTTNATLARIQKYITPNSFPNDTASGIYNNTITGKICIHLDYQPSNDVVYLFYNGQLISTNNYTVFNTGPDELRVELNFIPAAASDVMIFYMDAAGMGVNPVDSLLSKNNFNNLRVFIDQNFLDNSQYSSYNLRDFITLPSISDSFLTFGDEEFLLGNIITSIKATIFKSVITCDVLPSKFITSTNPTWNSNQDIVQFSEIGIYDEENDLVAIGKFSQPLKRKYNSDLLVIQATIDF